MLTSAARCYHSDHSATAKCPLNILVCYILIVLLQLTISSTTNISFCFNIYLFILSAPFFVICGQVVVQSLRLLPHFLVNFFVIFCFYFFFVAKCQPWVCWCRRVASRARVSSNSAPPPRNKLN